MSPLPTPWIGMVVRTHDGLIAPIRRFYDTVLPYVVLDGPKSDTIPWTPDRIAAVHDRDGWQLWPAPPMPKPLPGMVVECADGTRRVIDTAYPPTSDEDVWEVHGPTRSIGRWESDNIHVIRSATGQVLWRKP